MIDYTINEIFYSIQGEGIHSGRPAVFVRFTGCNLWDGQPKNRDKGKGACSKWCDTAFTYGQRMSAEAIITKMGHSLPVQMKSYDGAILCVLTGGEPCLQIDKELIAKLQSSGYHVAVETNGSIMNSALSVADHVCISPKVGAMLAVKRADELKITIPAVLEPEKGNPTGWPGERIAEFERGDFGVLWVCPLDTPLSSDCGDTILKNNGSTVSNEHAHRFNMSTNICQNWVKTRPLWRISTQMQKLIGAK